MAEFQTGRTLAFGLALLSMSGAGNLCLGQVSGTEAWIEAGHWKRARTALEARLREAPNDASANFFLSQIRAAFGDRSSPLPLAEKALALDPYTAKYHRQVAEVLGVLAEHSNPVQQLFLARRFRKEIEAALTLDPRDVQAMRDLLEFHLLAPGLLGGSRSDASTVAKRIAAVDPAEGFLARARIAALDRPPADVAALLQHAVEARPESYRAWMTLAEFCAAPEHPDPAKAAAAARAAIRLDPARTDAYAVLAGVCADRGSWKELDAVLADAVREAPDDLYPLYRAAGRLGAAAHDPDRAARYLRAYLAQEPEGNRPTLADARRLLSRIEDSRRRSTLAGANPGGGTP